MKKRRATTPDDKRPEELARALWTCALLIVAAVLLLSGLAR